MTAGSVPFFVGFSSRTKDRIEIAHARKGTSSAFLVLAGALLAGLGQLIGQTETFSAAFKNTAGLSAISAMSAVLTGAVILIIDIAQQQHVIHSRRVIDHHGRLETEGAVGTKPGNQILLDDANKLDEILSPFGRWTDWLLRIQIASWVLGATLYGAILILGVGAFDRFL